jgi:hypothetical protein
VEDGQECTTRNLRENEGWTGLLMDGSNANDAINLRQEFFTAENIVDHFEKYSVPHHFDHLTVCSGHSLRLADFNVVTLSRVVGAQIDIDQNTFWVLHSVLLAGFRPRTIVAEINRNFHPLDSFTVPYYPSKMWDATNAFGGSVGAFDKLFSDFGYHLIGAIPPAFT